MSPEATGEFVEMAANTLHSNQLDAFSIQVTVTPAGKVSIGFSHGFQQIWDVGEPGVVKIELAMPYTPQPQPLRLTASFAKTVTTP